MRPSAVRWYRMPAPGWFAEEGWSLTPEAAGMSRLMGRGPHLEPIVAMVRRRPGAARVLIGGRNLAGSQRSGRAFHDGDRRRALSAMGRPRRDFFCRCSRSRRAGWRVTGRWPG